MIKAKKLFTCFTKLCTATDISGNYHLWPHQGSWFPNLCLSTLVGPPHLKEAWKEMRRLKLFCVIGGWRVKVRECVRYWTCKRERLFQGPMLWLQIGNVIQSDALSLQNALKILVTPLGPVYTSILSLPLAPLSSNDPFCFPVKPSLLNPSPALRPAPWPLQYHWNALHRP